MKKLEDYQKEFDTLNEQLEQFKKILPDDFGVVGNKIVQENYILVIRTQSETSRYLQNAMKETAKTSESTLQKLVITDENLFKHDLNILFLGLLHEYKKQDFEEELSYFEEDNEEPPTKNFDKAVLEDFKSEEFKKLFKSNTVLDYISLFNELRYLKVEKGMNNSDDVVEGIVDNIDSGNLSIYGSDYLEITLYGEDWDDNEYDYTFEILRVKESYYHQNIKTKNDKETKITYF